MSTVLDTLIVKLGYHTDDAQLRRAQKRIQAVQEKFNQASRAFAVAGGALTAAGAGIVKSFAGFEAEFAKIEGLVGVAREELNKVKPVLHDIAAETGVGPRKLAEALFFVTSAGLRGQAALDVLRSAAKAAAAGLGETGEIARIVTGAVNAYGIENLSAAEATDQLTNAVRLGSLEPAELGGAIAGAIPFAAELGVRFSELSGHMASMSNISIGASEAATNLRGILRSFIKPTTEAEKAIGSMGLNFGSLRNMIGEKGLLPVLELLKKATAETGIQMSEIFPDTEALGGVLALTGKNAEQTRRIFEEMGMSTGVLDEAFEAAQNTLNFQFSRAISNAQSTIILLGEAMAPLVRAVLDRVIPALGRLREWFEGAGDWAKGAVAGLFAAGPALLGLGAATKTASFALGGLQTVFAPVTKMFLTLARALKNPQDALRLFTMKFPLLAKVLGFVMRPFQWLVRLLPLLGAKFILIGALIAAAALTIRKFWEPIKAFFTGVWNGIIEAAKPVGEELSALWSKIREAIAPLQPVFDWLSQAVKEVWNWFKEWIKPVNESSESVKAFGEAGTTVGKILGTVLLLPLRLLIGSLHVAAAVISAVGGSLAWLAGAARNLGKALLDGIVGGWAAVKEWFSNFSLADAGRAVIDGLLLALQFSPLVLIAKAFDKVAQWLFGFSLAEAGRAVIETLGSAIERAKDWLAEKVRGALGPVGRLLPSSDAEEGPLSRLTEAGRAIAMTLGAGVEEAGESGLVSPVIDVTRRVRDLAAETVGPVTEVVRRVREKVVEAAAPAGDAVRRVRDVVVETAAPVADATRRVREVAVPESASARAAPVIDFLSRLAIPPPIPPIPSPALAGAFAGPAPAGSVTKTVNIEFADNAINIHAPGGDPEVIASRVNEELARKLRNLVDDNDRRDVR